jgi:hypothetical protein
MLMRIIRSLSCFAYKQETQEIGKQEHMRCGFVSNSLTYVNLRACDHSLSFSIDQARTVV